jgi:outer membrane protein assembly factor BamB
MSGDSNTLLIQGPRVFVGKVALDLATGEPATGWTDPGLLPIDGRATAASGVAFFPGIGTTCPPAPCSGGIPRLQSVDAATGNLRWNTQLRRRPVYYQTLVVLDGVVYVDTTVPGGGSRLQGIDQATGTIDATIHTPSVVTLGGYLERAGMFASGSTVFINGSDRLVAEHVGT